MKNYTLKFGGVAAVLLTIVIMLLIFVAGFVYLIKSNLIIVNFTADSKVENITEQEKENNQAEETQKEQPVEQNSSNSSITGNFSKYIGTKDGTIIKEQVLQDVVSYNTSHEIGINVYISAEQKNEDEAMTTNANILLLNKEGLKSSEEYYNMQAGLKYKVFVTAGMDGIATDIYLVKLINQ